MAECKELSELRVRHDCVVMYVAGVTGPIEWPIAEVTVLVPEEAPDEA